MIFLHNDLFLLNEDNPMIIREEMLKSFSCEKLRKTCLKSSIIILGGVGFSGYCHKYNASHGLYLNGGRKVSLQRSHIDYYYENMPVYVEAVKEMFADYHKDLKSISKNIKAFGGSGKIHGSIVDIDYYNHVYLNPRDGSVTPYYAESITEKYAHENIAALLKKERPDLYSNYKKLIENNDSENAEQMESGEVSENMDTLHYIPETYMYKNSNIFKSIQYLIDVKVIRIWNDEIIDLKTKNSIDNKRSNSN